MPIQKPILFPFLLLCVFVHGQTVDLSRYKKSSRVRVTVNGNVIALRWPATTSEHGKMLLDLRKDKPLFKSIELSRKGSFKKIAANLDPAFILTIGKRDLVSQNGWNIFFDKVPQKPHKSFVVELDKRRASITTTGSRTIIRIYSLHTPSFKGTLEITLYNGSPLFNVAAVMSTDLDSTAILYDAGLIANTSLWNKIGWANTKDEHRTVAVNEHDKSQNVEVKYRTIIGESKEGSLAVFPPPHQYFYPLDEAFNLRFTWYGSNYRQMIRGFGLGIRQDLYGDKRYVPWFNAPPKTKQRLNFFCLLSTGKAGLVLNEVKKFTHGDRYIHLPGFKTLSSHFHNEFITNVVLAKKPVPEKPAFVKVFKETGIDIGHLGEFHYTAHPKGPDEQRLTELKALFDQCKRLSDKNFLLLPGEEPNEFFGGHWMALFPKPVYWIMSRRPGSPFMTQQANYGTVYRVANKDEMLKLLEIEKGLAWTAHARTKGSTGFPDRHRDEGFFKSGTFMGAAWKAMPADLSQPRLGKRVLDLMDDMNNWGLKKHVIAEADLFSVEPQNEMYAHLNVNYLQLNPLPAFEAGWQPVLDALKNGKFFSSTGEVLLPSFTVNRKGSGETVQLDGSGKAKIALSVNWTFPLNFAEIISGDGKKVYRKTINLNYTKAFGKQKFIFPIILKNRKWVRVEVWDVAVNGAFTQTVWIK
jgi:hypothetical protein